MPTPYNVDDILVLFVETAFGESVSASGWTHAGDSPSPAAAGTQLSVLWRRANGTETAGASIPDPGDHAVARIVAFRDATTAGVPFDVTNKGFTGTGPAATIPGDTTTVVDCLVIVAAAIALDSSHAGFFYGWTNADLAAIVEHFDEGVDVGNGGGFAMITGTKAALGAVGSTTATMNEATDYAGWFGALIGSATANDGEEVDQDPYTPPEAEVYTPPLESTLNIVEFAVDTWQFDTPEDDPEDRDPIDWYLAWQSMDNSSESRDKSLTAIRVTGKLTDASVSIHAASPGDVIDQADIEGGTDSRATIALDDSTEITRYERAKVRIHNLSLWTARISGTWNGQGRKDRLDELIIEGRPHGVSK